MQTTIQVTFRQMPASPSVESHIREQVQELEHFSDRITRCRVLVEAPSAHHAHGGLYRVRVELALPESRIVVGGAPPTAPEHEDLFVALRDVFRAARRRLEDHTRRVRGEVKSHHAS
jgi:ribosome-associated translation inhibitor RaiA